MTTHVYVGWAVRLANGNVVNFIDQDRRDAHRYRDEYGTDITRTEREIQCGLERGRMFCSHCTEATYTQ